MDVRSALNWARKEKDILIGEVSEETKDEAAKAIEAAETAYEALMTEYFQSGYSSAALGKAFLKRLCDGLPLTPITEENAEWTLFNEKNKMYRSGRYSKLFKICTDEGDVYIDPSRFKFVDVDDPDSVGISSQGVGELLNIIAEQLFRVELPYLPSDKKIIIFYQENAHNTDRILAVTHYMLEGTVNPQPIKKFYKAVNADECDIVTSDTNWIEIDKEKFVALNFRIERANKEEK